MINKTITPLKEDKNAYERDRYFHIEEVRASKLLRQHLYYIRNQEKIKAKNLARYWAKKQKENDTKKES